MLAAQREHEEKKVPLLGNLMASIPFDEEIDRGQANLLLRLAEDVSYRQLCILALLGDRMIFAETDTPPRNVFIPELRKGAYSGKRPDFNTIAILQEAWDLQSRSLAYVGPTAMDYRWIDPSQMELWEMGLSLYQSMELWEISRDDKQEVAEFLR
jgi:hypothetical protein